MYKFIGQRLFCIFLNAYLVTFSQITTLSSSKLGNNVFCPEELRSLFDQCCATVINKRPSISHVAKTLLVSSLSKKKKRKKISDNKVMKCLWGSKFGTINFVTSPCIIIFGPFCSRFYSVSRLQCW